jgi:hypothetical protein
LNDLVNIRTILKIIPSQGYEFAVSSFPQIVSRARITIYDMLESLADKYGKEHL